MHANEEGRTHKHVTTGSAQIGEALHRLARIGDVLKNLFADHHVPLPPQVRRIAKVEVRPPEHREVLPLLTSTVRVAADFDRVQAARIEDGQ